jgi:hypothetical protein
MILARGDRRDFVVIDHAGGMHALGKRILGIPASQIRDRLADVDRDELPTVEHACSFVREQQAVRERAKTEAMPDPHSDELAWQDALAKAAIEKEKVERRFAEPKPEKEMTGGREKEGRVWAETAHSTPDKFKDTGLEIAGSTGPEKPLKGLEKRLWDAYRSGPEAHDFAATLDTQGIAFARVTPDEAYKSYREAQFAKALGRGAPVYQESEIVVVRSPGPECLRQGEWAALPRVQRLDQAHAEKYLEALRVDKSKLKGIEPTKAILETSAQDRAAYWQAIRLENAQRIWDGAPTTKKVTRVPAALGKTAERAVGKALDFVGSALEAALAPVLTPEQKREGALTQAERSADTREKLDISIYLADLAARRRRLEEERAANPRRERDDRER